MSFTQFTRAGHKALSAEITRELQDLASRLNLNISATGGSIGENELVVKVTAMTNDTQAIEAAEKRDFALCCSHVGLQPGDYGLEFTYNRSRFRLVGVKPTRPKYPISAIELDGSRRSFKLPRGAVPAIENARHDRDAKAAAQKSLSGNKIEEEGLGLESEWA